MTESQEKQVAVKSMRIQEFAKLLSCCPQVLPPGIGVEQYMQELIKGADALYAYIKLESE